MRDTVCIVLNEREARKHQVAGELARMLSEHNITASRIEIDESIEQRIVERCPKILVLDYLLGDYSTGLDVLSRVIEIPEERRPAVFFLTDEPSVHVAVEAVKMGALDYLELDNPQSINRIARQIEELVHSSRGPVSKKSSGALARGTWTRTTSEFIAHTPKARALLDGLKSVAMKGPPILVLIGRRGSGLSAASDIFFELKGPGEVPPRLVDLRFALEPLPELIGTTAGAERRLGTNLPVLVDHAEEDDGELWELIRENFSALWGKRPSLPCSSPLVLLTTQEEQARAWGEISEHVTIIRNPSLQDRCDDIPLLAQRFLLEAMEMSGGKNVSLASSVGQWLKTVAWPGEVRELCAVIQHATMLLNTPGAKADQFQDMIAEAKLLWEEQSVLSQHPALQEIEELQASQALYAACGHVRYAAAAMGVGVRRLQKMIVGRRSQESHGQHSELTHSASAAEEAATKRKPALDKSSRVERR